MQKDLEKKLEIIAKKYNIQTLKTQNNDEEDFYNLAVWTIKAMLEEAYNKGVEDTKTTN